MKSVETLPVRVIGVSKASGGSYLETDRRVALAGLAGTLEVFESEARFPGKKAGEFRPVASKSGGEFEFASCDPFLTTFGETFRNGSEITIETANSVYRFEELTGEELAEYEAFLDGFTSANAPISF